MALLGTGLLGTSLNTHLASLKSETIGFVKENPQRANFHNMLFIIDTSSSISDDEFKSTQDQLARLIGLFCPVNEAFGCVSCHQAALIQFSTTVEKVFDFTDKFYTADIERSIRNLRPLRQNTCTAEAFRYAKTMIRK